VRDSSGRQAHGRWVPFLAPAAVGRGGDQRKPYAALTDATAWAPDYERIARSIPKNLGMDTPKNHK